MNQNLVFFSNFLKKPKEIASAVPSSRYVIRNILKHIDFENAECIIEYGPGIGNITGALLKRLKPRARLICFETNKKFCRLLGENMRDTRLKIVNDTAKNLDFYLKKDNIANVDYVISGIPFSLINMNDKKSIICKTRDSLRLGGKFIVYQLRPHMKKYLGIYFKKILLKIEIRNIPPTFIFICEKT